MDRDLVGYAATPPRVTWPNGARVVISLVVNYMRARELLQTAWPALVVGDAMSRRALSGDSRRVDFDTAAARASCASFRTSEVRRARHLLRVRGRAQRNPRRGRATRSGHASRPGTAGRYYLMDKGGCAGHPRRLCGIERLTGQGPLGWYCRYGPSENTRELVVEHGGFIYDSNAYNDDLPYYTKVGSRKWLVIPYSLALNDSRFWRGYYSTGDDFFQAAKETFDTLYEEGETTPKMMSMGLHCRMAGVPTRANGLDRFIAYAKNHSNVWFAGRSDIAKWWLEHQKA